MDDVAMVVEEVFPAVLARQVEKGEKKYGRRLQTWNGRDAAQDAVEELVDAFQYVSQLKLERDEYAFTLWFFAEAFDFAEHLSPGMKENMRKILPKELYENT